MVFRGFTLEACRRFGIKGNNAHNITVEQMEIKNRFVFNELKYLLIIYLVKSDKENCSVYIQVRVHQNRVLKRYL